MGLDSSFFYIFGVLSFLMSFAMGANDSDVLAFIYGSQAMTLLTAVPSNHHRVKGLIGLHIRVYRRLLWVWGSNRDLLARDSAYD